MDSDNVMTNQQIYDVGQTKSRFYKIYGIRLKTKKGNAQTSIAFFVVSKRHQIPITYYFLPITYKRLIFPKVMFKVENFHTDFFSF